MATKLAATKKPAFEIANLLDDAADAIRDRSKQAYGAGKMSLDEYMDARAQELELRSELQVIVATNLSAALQQASEAGENIEQAIVDAKTRIETIRSVKNGLKIVAALVTLAAALASGEVKTIVKAGKAVADLT
ncbi:hypothetical protein LJR143_001603 [Pseudoxanthomonas sp. LjRoot143]|uniref:hypothetical protein n=1 Tax=unclassified Pseudoxanthomonas TaxID=2645906 RepID=UPI0007032813|nr:hypothetical protein [Pseudoxanthomonas sp. Root630]KRA50274.1 hypothetical protein ASD72_18860 [Pseudoxanthomonas sp. Root630]PZQ34295.1 MAG: hypothetical protein DI562_00190 [Stenotrophomonas acidaminiphila]